MQQSQPKSNLFEPFTVFEGWPIGDLAQNGTVPQIVTVGDLAQLFGNLTQPQSPVSGNIPVSIYESDRYLQYELNVPGAQKENIKVSFKAADKRLDISVSYNITEKGLTYSNRPVEQSLSIGLGLHPNLLMNETRVDLRNGILMVRIPKIAKVEPEVKFTINT